ncbi:MAG: hypothetical protein H7839_21915 [Magnetococcus sp. YQC-5]
MHRIAIQRASVAGSSPLNLRNPRFSGDIDVFHDREERVASAYAQDSALLREQGFDLQDLRREPTFYAVLVRRGDEVMKLIITDIIKRVNR